MGSSNENSAYGPVHNPWNLDTVPGGSSGGSAASVAAGEAVWALGTDTGGSVRQPASAVRRGGVQANLRPDQPLRPDRLRLLARPHRDLHPRRARLRDACWRRSPGTIPRDATSLSEPVPDYHRALEGGVAGLRIGVLEDWLTMEGIEPGVRDSVRAAIDRLAALGAEVDTVSLPHADYALSAYYLIAPAECSSNLARYDGVRYGYRAPGASVEEMNLRTRGQGFGDEVKRRIMLGTYSLSAGYYDAYYGQAQKVRTLVIRDFEAAFERFDLIAGPTSPTVAFALGAKTADPLAMYLSDIYTIPANLSGMPAISIPCGLSDGLPVGFQLMGRLLDEATVLRAAAALEQDLAFEIAPPILADLPA